MTSPLTELLRRPRRPRILVVGDVMLDRYLFGDVERISPEAPIPVLAVDRQEHRLGGAGSVAAMLAALEADVHLAAVVGDDPEGRIVVELLGQLGVDAQAVAAVEGRSTTLKERLLGRTHSRHPQQMIRVDREQCRPIAEETARRLIASIDALLPRVELVLLSDYAKGVCSGGLVGQIVEGARALGVPVVADPVRDADFTRYAGCACITPNRGEAATALGITIAAADDGIEAARRMLDFGVEAAMVTLDRDGIAWADVHGNARRFPVRARQVYDITGAGDMVLSALGYAMAMGADWQTAVELANLAAGLEVERLGVVPVTRGELAAALAHDAFDTRHKIVGVETLQAEFDRRRASGQRIAMTNGCFDLLHPGHVASLQAARAQGDCLVVGLNSDRSVEKLKGSGHPVLNQHDRAAMLAALACVDYVVLFDDASVAGLVRQVRPDVLVKSDQYAVEEVVGHEIVELYGGRVVRVPMKGDYSTGALIEKIRRTV